METVPVGTHPALAPAYLAGAEAAVDGVPAHACPYGPDRRVSRCAWLAGHVQASRLAGRLVPADVLLEVDELPEQDDTPS